MREPQVVTNLRAIEKTIASRSPFLFIPPPASWSIPAFQKFGGNRLFAPPFKTHQNKSLEVSGLGVFDGKPVTIKVARNITFTNQTFYVPGMSMWEATPRNARNEKHNIQIGRIRVTEHPQSFLSGMNVGGAWEFSRPCFAGSSAVMTELSIKFLEQCTPVELPSKGLSKKPKECLLEPHALRHPVLFNFPSGAYIIYKPPDAWQNPNHLTIDLQFSHERNFLGTQRIVAEITPEFFAFIAAARPPSYGVRGLILRYLVLGSKRKVFRTGFFQDNFVMVGKNRLLNRNPKFDDIGGTNREAICHELIDKLGAVALLGLRRKLVGTLIFNRTSHADDVAMLKKLQSQLLPLKNCTNK